MSPTEENWRCPLCHRFARPIEVHGHVQCSDCGQNVDPCCSGETASCSAAGTDFPSKD